MNFLFTRQDLQRLVEPARFERGRMLAETIDDLYEDEWIVRDHPRRCSAP